MKNALAVINLSDIHYIEKFLVAINTYVWIVLKVIHFIPKKISTYYEIYVYEGSNKYSIDIHFVDNIPEKLTYKEVCNILHTTIDLNFGNIFFIVGFELENILDNIKVCI